MDEWILYVMTWASQLSGYPFPDKLRDVQWEVRNGFTQFLFHRLACKRGA